MPILSGSASLYDMLIFNICKDYAKDCHEDLDTEGDHQILLAMAKPHLDEDEKYREEVGKLEMETLEGPDTDHGESEEAFIRRMNFKHLGIIMCCLKRRGCLDKAPIPTSQEGLNYL